MIEYVEHLHEHFEAPVVMNNGRYTLPLSPGYSTKMKGQTISDYEYPDGNVWKKMFLDGKFAEPQLPK